MEALMCETFGSSMYLITSPIGKLISSLLLHTYLKEPIIFLNKVTSTLSYSPCLSSFKIGLIGEYAEF